MGHAAAPATIGLIATALKDTPMTWTAGQWPPHAGDPIDADLIMNEIRQALVERNRLVPAGWTPRAFSRWQALRGTPHGGSPAPSPTVANFQYQIREMLTLVWPVAWWDPSRGDLYTLPNLCHDAFGKDAWSCDLTAQDGQGRSINTWTPARALIFDELYAAINKLDRVRILPTLSESVRRDSVYQLALGITNWARDRADAFAPFDGEDDEQSVGLEFDVGLGGEVLDGGSMAQWFLESRQFQMVFATAALTGCTLRQAWLDFSIASPGGTADFSGTLTAEVVDETETVLSTFASTESGFRRLAIPTASIRTDGDSTFTIRSTRPNAADRPGWSPAGPDYSSTYREGLAIAGPIRLIVEVDFEYHG
jgi:hypothetical protein